MKHLYLKKVILNNLSENKITTIAVSGGIDSITLATFSNLLKPKLINIAHAISDAVPEEATKRVNKLAKKFNWKLYILNANEINDPKYKQNPYNRCYFCKDNLYKTIKAEINTDLIFSGTNIDDLNDYRPGLKAAKLSNIRHPFIEANFNKTDIRKLANKIGLEEYADIPASPCLASRIETGIPISKKLLNGIEIIEKNIKELIPKSDVRCRWMNSKVNIQFKSPHIKDITDNQKNKIINDVHNIFLINKNKIKFSEYKIGSAFIPKIGMEIKSE